jgi:ABC-type glycerol-3-phosphate transport system permease component
VALLPKVGRRSPKVLVAIVLIYTVLIGGAVTMFVPFLITLNQSVASSYDLEQYNLFPVYLVDDDRLYMKFLFQKYEGLERIRFFHQLTGISTVRELRAVRDPVQTLFPIAARYPEDRRDARAIRADFHAVVQRTKAEQIRDVFGADVSYIHHDWYRDRYLRLARAQGLIDERTADPNQVALDLMHRTYGEIVAASFTHKGFATGTPRGPRIYWPDKPSIRDFRAFWNDLEVKFKRPFREDHHYGLWLTSRHIGIDRLNAAWQTHYDDFVQIRFTDEPPAHQAQRRDWRDYVEKEFPLRRTVIRGDFANDFRAYLREKIGDLESLNRRLGTNHASWEQVPFTPTYTGTRAYRHLWSDFVLDRVEAGARELHFFEKDVYEYLRDKYGTVEALSAAYNMPIASFETYRVPHDLLDYDEFHHNRGYWRWNFLTRNYSLVLKFIALHGRALWNTLVLVGLTTLAALTINPLAAYALSRFKLSGTQGILVFLLIPMAFPAEVSMIPSFLLLKRFPLGSMLCGAAVGGVALVLLRVAARWVLGRSFTKTALVAACVIAWFGGPMVSGFLGVGPDVSLLNTYAALILPGLANGFSIFLLKGFFDGLPRELYEAAQLDGAGELRMFRIITYPLCKPILMVTVIGNVLAAYGGFMWAFIVCQDENMWTLMVWLYAFTTQYGGHNVPLIMASLVIASIPTLLIFVVCQRVIMRGIILPTMD